jgi:hypothetical protein
MKPVAAIVETDIASIADQVIETHRLMREAEAKQADHTERAARAGEAAQMRRLELGKLLLHARLAYPQRGPKAKGWGEFLAKVGIEQSTAWRYMDLVQPGVAPKPDVQVDSSRDFMQGAPVHETGANPGPSIVGGTAANTSPEQVAEPEVEIDRDTWCTPKWITDAIGRWDLDPCANARSHVDAERCFLFEELGEDGLDMSAVRKRLDIYTPKQWSSLRAFINPPYSKVMPWIEAYGDTRFCFLLKLDISTKWFEALLAKCELVLMPRRTRIQFEAPPGVPPDQAIANQFPHALFYARAKDATDAIKALCFPGWFPNRG